MIESELDQLSEHEQRICEIYANRGVTAEHFLNKPQWAHHPIWTENNGSYPNFCATLLKNNPLLDVTTLSSLVHDFDINGEDGNYFHFLFLVNHYHYGVRNNDFRNFSSEDCCRIEYGIGRLMKKKNLTFQEAYLELTDLSQDEIEIYTQLNRFGLLKEELINSKFHKPYFLGISQNRFLAVMYSLLHRILPTTLLDNYLSWPEKTLTQAHVNLIVNLSKVIDGAHQMPVSKRIIELAEHIEEQEALCINNCLQQLRAMLYRADQMEVIQEHEDSILPEDQYKGRPSYSEYLKPLPESSLSLRIEKNKPSGRVQTTTSLDFESLTPIHHFVLACCARYGLNIADIEHLNGIDLCEYACSFLAYRIEKTNEDSIAPSTGCSLSDTKERINDQKLNLHEQRVLSLLAPYGLDESTLLSSPLHGADNHFTFRHSQAIITLFAHKTGFPQVNCKPPNLNPQELLHQVETMTNDELDTYTFRSSTVMC